MRLWKRHRVPVIREKKGGHPFYPHHLIRNTMAVLGAIAVLAALAGLFPAPIEQRADTLSLLPPDTAAVPMWLMRPVWLMNRVLNAPTITLLVFGGAFVFVLLIPFLDRDSEDSPLRHLFVAIIFLLWMFFIFITTWLLPVQVFLP